MRIYFDLANPAVIKTNFVTVVFVQKFSVQCDDDQILQNVSSKTCALWCTMRPPFENTHSLFAAEAGIAKTTFARVDKMGKVA